MFNKDVVKAFAISIIVVIAIVIVMNFSHIFPKEPEVEVKEIKSEEVMPDEDYETNTDSITSGYYVADNADVEVTCMSPDDMENVSYIIANSFCIGLQKYCDENGITEKFTPIEVRAGQNTNITLLDVKSDSYSFTLSYDISTDYVEVSENE